MKYIIILFLFSSCFVNKNIKTEENFTNRDYINASINDYVRHDKLIENDSVFKIFVVTDTLKCGTSLKCFKITPLVDKVILNEYDTIGAKSDVVYNQYLVKKNKLFLWIDPNETLNEETFEIMKKYNKVVKVSNNDVVTIVEFFENQRCYSFCENDLTDFKSSKYWIKKRKPIHNRSCK